MLYREIIVVCFAIHTKCINTVCGQNVGFLIVKLGDAYSNQWALKGSIFNSMRVYSTTLLLVLSLCYISNGLLALNLSQ